MNSINLVLGTMTFGPQVDLTESRKMVHLFVDAGYSELDTAHVYNDGQTETILGTILPTAADAPIKIATKVHPRITGTLDRIAIRSQLTKSLQRLNLTSVDLLYLHLPDPHTPIEETLSACAELHDEGLFRELGLSNYPAWLVVDMWHLCQNRGWPTPSVYQGLYNSLSRGVEDELMPALRRLGIRFYAYNPLAGGMLTGKHVSYHSRPESGRFALRQSYRDRYWRETYLNAVNDLSAQCRKHEIEPAEAAYRWLAHHSHLNSSDGDRIIVGASSTVQLEKNLRAAAKEPLPEAIVEAFESAWQEAKPDSPKYFQFYGEH